jgi:branched chain amino acid efflux pump
MGIAFGPSVPGRAPWRALQGQAVVDSSWAMALRPDGRFDRIYLFGHSGAQYVGWLLGTALGAYGGEIIGDPQKLGLDAIFPAFFVAILVSELGDRQGRIAALLGAVLALALVSVTPPGVPVVAASVVSLLGLHPRMRRGR